MKPDIEDAAGIERRLEALADDIAAAIGEGHPSDRESLHDYAVSLVRERLPVAAEMGSQRRETEPGLPGSNESEREPASGGVQAIGFGMLLVPVGFLLAWIFPPVGLLLMVAGGAMVVWGMAAAMFGKVFGRAKDADAGGD